MTLLKHRIRVDDITLEQLDAMYALMMAYYENVNRQVFEKDLFEKDWVLVIQNEGSGNIVGFSTQMLINLEYQGENINVLFSGDTILSKEHWGKMTFIQALGGLVMELIKLYPRKDLYWMLISKGLRTYKYLPTCFIEYYPNYKKPTPNDVLKLMQHLGHLKYPESYDPVSGIIQAGRIGQYLKAEYQLLPDPAKPEESFFNEKNPGFWHGDELLCLAKVSLDNFRPYILKVLNRL